MSDFSVRYSKDLIIRTVMTAEVFGRARFVRISESADSVLVDMLGVDEVLDD